MRAFGISVLAAFLMGCTSAPDRSLQPRQPQLHEAAAQAEATGDFRPYPEGWPGFRLPARPDPKIVESIQLGQKRAEVAAIMGRSGWSHTATRREFPAQLRETYRDRSASRKLPKDVGEAVKRVPKQGQFVRWLYQGFPSTGDWIVVFFACPEDAFESELRVIARGVFPLGCL